MPFKPFDRFAVGLHDLEQNFKSGIQGFAKYGTRLPRAVIGNIQRSIIRPAFSGAASLTVVPGGYGAAVAPLAAALGAVDLTLSGVDKVFSAIGLPDRQKIQEKDFVKKSDAGKAIEQFLFGEITTNDIPPNLRSKMQEEIASKEGKEFIKEALEDAGLAEDALKGLELGLI